MRPTCIDMANPHAVVLRAPTAARHPPSTRLGPERSSIIRCFPGGAPYRRPPSWPGATGCGLAASGERGVGLNPWPCGSGAWRRAGPAAVPPAGLAELARATVMLGGGTLNHRVAPPTVMC